MLNAPDERSDIWLSLATKQRPSVPAAHSVRRRRADARVDPFDRLDYALGVPLVSHGRAFVRAMTGDSERQPLLTPASEGTTGRKSGAWASRLAGACGRATREPSTERNARSTPRGSSRLSTPAFPAENAASRRPIAPVSSRDPPTGVRFTVVRLSEQTTARFRDAGLSRGPFSF